jgi:threonine dehydratase
VLLEGDSIDSSAVFAREVAQREGLIFVHPYDDEKIVAGQGTIGLELFADAPQLDTVIVPIGGGGILAGIATALKALKPAVDMIGVEAALYPSMHHAVQDCAGQWRQTIAEGMP